MMDWRIYLEVIVVSGLSSNFISTVCIWVAFWAMAVTSVLKSPWPLAPALMWVQLAPTELST